MESFLPDVEQEVAPGNQRRTVQTSASYLLSSFIFSALLVVMALAVVPYGTVEPQWEAVFECSVFALTALSIVEGLLARSSLLEGYRLVIPLFALTGLAVFQFLPWWGQV